MAIAQVFFDQDLRYGIDGLRTVLQQKRIAIKALKDSSYVLFVNRSRKQCKMISFTSRGAWLTTFRVEKGRIALDDLKRLPTLYKETGFINGKMETQLKEYLGRGVQVYTEGADLKVVG
jgi:hypothetical protein